MNNSKSAGFTLLELTIAIFIFTMMIAAVSNMFIYLLDAYSFSFEQSRTVSEVKLAFRSINNELREIKTSEDGAYAIFQADDNAIGFYADIDNDGRTERVRYYLSGNDFFKAVLEPNDTQTPYTGTETETLITNRVFNSTEPVFTYYNGAWPGDTTNNPLIQSQRLLDTRLIGVRLELNTAEDQQENFIVETKVTMRNIKTNY